MFISVLLFHMSRCHRLGWMQIWSKLSSFDNWTVFFCFFFGWWEVLPPSLIPAYETSIFVFPTLEFKQILIFPATQNTFQLEFLDFFSECKRIPGKEVWKHETNLVHSEIETSSRNEPIFYFNMSKTFLKVLNHKRSLSKTLKLKYCHFIGIVD